MRPTAKSFGLHEALEEGLDDVADMIMGAARQSASETKELWRQELRAAGMSQRLANTIREKVYPERGRALDPAALIFTRAPQIIASMIESIEIRPVHAGRFKGRPMLWIPTQNVPLAGKGRRMTPEQVESAFAQRFIIISARKPGHYLALVNVIQAKNRKGWRKVTSGRVAQGRNAVMKLMFVLAPFVRTKKRLDLGQIAERGNQIYANHVNRAQGIS